MQTGMKLAPGEIPASVMDGILLLLKETRYGQIVLVAQDRRLIQVERREKIRVKEGQLARIACRISEQAFPEFAERIRASFRKLDYGQLVLVVKDGDVVQMERTVKERFTGLNGEGI